MKKLIFSFIIVLSVLFNISVVRATNNSVISIDTEKLESGILNVNYLKENPDSKLKVIVKKEGKRITYDLRNDGTAESFPLQFGNGEYNVAVLENISGNNYRYIFKETVSLQLDNQLTVYLASIQNINWDGDDAAIKKAAELTKGLKSDNQKIEAIYEFVVSNIKYDYKKASSLASGYVPDIDQIILDKKGICYDFASTFAAMLRSQGIPTKLIKGYTPNAVGYHAWNEVYNTSTGKWMVIDTTYDSQLKQLKAKYSMDKKAKQYNAVNEY